MIENRSKSKKILMIAPTPFFADRGCHVRILGEAKALIALGNELLLCTYGLGRDIEPIPTVRTMSLPWYKKLSPGPSVHKIYVDLLLLWNVLWACRSFRPDIIHAHLHEGIAIGKVASKLFGIPLVADLQGSLTAELVAHKALPDVRWLVKPVQWLEKLINRMPLHLIASSTHMGRVTQNEFDIPAQRLTTLMDGVDLDVFSPGEPDPHLRGSLGIQPDERVVVFIGVLTEYQGIDLLIKSIPQVVKECPKAKFLIIGYPDEEHYRAQARALGVEEFTLFTGKIPYADAPRYLSLAQVAVSPKISTTEANLKLFTYMAMGLPTVVFDNPVNREILGDLGSYARFGDVADLARVLTGLLNDEEEARQLGAACRQKAIDDYSWLAVGRQLGSIYDSQIESPNYAHVKHTGNRWGWFHRFTLNR
jgi:glycosyltransferase involved in cell wall biosynthesis